MSGLKLLRQVLHLRHLLCRCLNYILTYCLLKYTKLWFQSFMFKTLEQKCLIDFQFILFFWFTISIGIGFSSGKTTCVFTQNIFSYDIQDRIMKSQNFLLCTHLIIALLLIKDLTRSLGTFSKN